MFYMALQRMRWLVFTPVLLLALAGCITPPNPNGPVTQNIPFTVLAEGSHSGFGPGEGGYYYFTDESAWASFWNAKGVPDGTRIDLPSSVDFSQEHAIVLATGTQPTGGYVIRVQRIEFFDPCPTPTNPGGVQCQAVPSLRVYVSFTFPGPNEVVTQVLSSPYQVVKIPVQPLSSESVTFIVNGVENRPTNPLFPVPSFNPMEPYILTTLTSGGIAGVTTTLTIEKATTGYLATYESALFSHAFKGTVLDVQAQALETALQNVPFSTQANVEGPSCCDIQITTLQLVQGSYSEEIVVNQAGEIPEPIKNLLAALQIIQNTIASFDEGEPTLVWMEFTPKQCGSNPWENSQIAPNKEVEKEWVLEWLAQQGILPTQVEFKPAPEDTVVCLACSCLRGDTLRVLVPAFEVQAMNALGFAVEGIVASTWMVASASPVNQDNPWYDKETKEEVAQVEKWLLGKNIVPLKIEFGESFESCVLACVDCCPPTVRLLYVQVPIENETGMQVLGFEVMGPEKVNAAVTLDKKEYSVDDMIIIKVSNFSTKPILYPVCSQITWEVQQKDGTWKAFVGSGPPMACAVQDSILHPLSTAQLDSYKAGNLIKEAQLEKIIPLSNQEWTFRAAFNYRTDCEWINGQSWGPCKSSQTAYSKTFKVI